MVQINFALREVNCKIVYYGPGLSGKTTNLEIVHQKAPESNKGELTSIATEGDRTLFFDFMPLDLGTIAGMRTRFQLYTVPGQVYYNSTRKLVLQGVDGVVFVADSSASKIEENLESLENLKNNLAEYGKDIHELPVVIQWNKRDLLDALPVEELNAKINAWDCPTFEAVAVTGEGVFPTLKCLSGMVLETLNRDQREAPGAAPRPQPVAAAVTPAAHPAFTAPPPPARVQQRAPRPATATSHGVMPPPAPRPPAGGRFGGAGVFDEMTGSGDARAIGTPAPAQHARVARGGTMPQGNWQRQQRRQVDASPLESAAIRPSPRGASLDRAQPRLNIQEQRSFPWLAVGLGLLIVVAIGVILTQTGLPSLPF